MSRKGLVLFVAMCIIWGIPYLLIRVAVRQLDPTTLVFARCGLAALVLVPVAALRGELLPVLRRWPWVVAFGAVEMGVPWLLMSRAEQHLTSSMTALLVAAVPICGVVLYRGTHHEERLTAARLAGLLLGTAGVAVLVGVNVANAAVLPVVEMLVVVVGYTLGPLIIASKLGDLGGVGVSAVATAVVGLAYAPLGLTALPTHLRAETLWSVATLGLVCTAVAFVTFFALIVEIGPARSTVVTYVNPAVAVVLGVSLLGEPITVGMVVGFPMILVGSVLATRKPEPAVETATSAA